MPFLAGQKVYAEDLNLVPVEGENTVDVTTTSTSYVFGGTAVSATFTAPPSGRVTVQVWATQDNNTAIASSYMTFQVREGTSQSGTVVADPLDLAVYRTSGVTTVQAGSGRPYLVTGLTAGATYTAWGRLRVSAGTGTWYATSITVDPKL